MAKSTLRVVLDSNVLISALVFGGTPKAVLDDGFKEQYRLITSTFISEEVKRGLVKLGHDPTEAELLLESYETSAELVYLEEVIPLSRDSKDDPILATAMTGKASHLVTGDNDLLELKTVNGTKIITPAQFLSLQK